MSLDLGDLPGWLQAISTTAQAGQMVWTERQRRAGEFAAQLETEAAISGDALAEAIAADGRLLGAFELAFEAAVRSATEEKRWLLARVLAIALTNLNRDDVIEQTPFFLRTVDAIEPAHVRLLVIVATPDIDGDHVLTQTALEGASRRSELEARWPESAALIDPLLRGLEAAGLVSDVAVGTWGYTPAWALTTYGRAFLEFLPNGPLPSADLDSAEVVARYDKTAQGQVWVRNVGPARATGISVNVPKNTEGVPLIAETEPFELAPWETRMFDALPPSADLQPPYRIVLSWHDATGERRRVRTVPTAEPASPSAPS